MAHPIPLRISQAKLWSWWRPRGYPAGDLFDWFSRLCMACDDAYLPIRMRQIDEASKRAARKNPPSGSIKADDDD